MAVAAVNRREGSIPMTVIYGDYIIAENELKTKQEKKIHKKDFSMCGSVGGGGVEG